MPPIIAASIEAGSGPMRRPCAASSRLRWPPTTPGCARIRAAVVEDARARGRTDRSRRARRPTTAWPESDVPAARKVRWRPRRRAQAKQRAHLRGVARTHDRLGDQPVDRRVGRAAQAVDRCGSARAPARGSARGRTRRAGSQGRMADGLSLGRWLADVHLEAVARAAGVQRDDGRLARGEPVARHALGVGDEHACRPSRARPRRRVSRTSTPAKRAPPFFWTRTMICAWPPPAASCRGSAHAATTIGSLTTRTGPGSSSCFTAGGSGGSGSPRGGGGGGGGGSGRGLAQPAASAVTRSAASRAAVPGERVSRGMWSPIVQRAAAAGGGLPSPRWATTRHGCGG